VRAPYLTCVPFSLNLIFRARERPVLLPFSAYRKRNDSAEERDDFFIFFVGPRWMASTGDPPETEPIEGDHEVDMVVDSV
jgi:hypothetical protein